jgi:hypothetical protein
MYAFLQRKQSLLEAAVASTLFSCEHSVHLKGIIPGSYMFHGGDQLFLCQVGLFCWVEETLGSHQGIPCILEPATSSTLFLCENWVSFWKEYIVQIIVFLWRKVHFVPNKIFSLVKETHVTLERKPSLLEAAASSTLFFCENWVSFERNA